MGGIEQAIIDFGRSFVSGGSGFFGWLLRNWIAVVPVLLILGVALDWTVWILRFPRERRREALLRRLTGREAGRRRRAPQDPPRAADPATRLRDPDEPKTLVPGRKPAPAPPQDARAGSALGRRYSDGSRRPGGNLGFLPRRDRPGFLRRPQQAPRRIPREHMRDDGGADQ